MVDYIKFLDKIIEFINKDTLKHTAFKLNTDNKVYKFFIKDYLKLMIYYHILQKDSLRDLSFGIGMSEKLKVVIVSIRLSIFSYHNNKRNHEVFLPILTDLINRSLNIDSVNETLKCFYSLRLTDSITTNMSLNIYQ